MYSGMQCIEVGTFCVICGFKVRWMCASNICIMWKCSVPVPLNLEFQIKCDHQSNVTFMRSTQGFRTYTYHTIPYQIHHCNQFLCRVFDLFFFVFLFSVVFDSFFFVMFGVGSLAICTQMTNYRLNEWWENDWMSKCIIYKQISHAYAVWNRYQVRVYDVYRFILIFIVNQQNQKLESEPEPNFQSGCGSLLAYTFWCVTQIWTGTFN